MPKIQIDGLDFHSEDLSEAGRSKFESLQYLEKRIAKLNSQMVIYRTAKRAFENTLKEKLEASEEIDKDGS